VPATLEHYIKDGKVTSHGQSALNAIRALDYALTRPEIDPERVGIIGLSSGGHVAMNVLALDKRVKAGIVSGCLCSWNHFMNRLWIPGHCICGVDYQLYPRLDMADWAALAAPKPVQYQHGRQDPWLGPRATVDFKVDAAYLASQRGFYPLAEHEILFSEILRAYNVFGAAEKVTMHIHTGGHAVDGPAAMAWFNQWLANKSAQSGNPSKEKTKI
jgi:dienelactone hydrolase